MMVDLVRSLGQGKVLSRIETHDPRIWAGQAPLQSLEAVDVQRRGKMIVVSDSNTALVVHLRMTGQIRRAPDHRKPRMEWFFETKERVVLLDTRCLARVEWVPHSQLEATWQAKKLGEEFWPHGRSGVWWRTRLGRRDASLKTALLDQSRVVGVGNIAASELLWRAQLDPHCLLKDLQESQWEAMARAADAHVAYCLDKEDADTLSFVTSGGPNFFKVYGKEGQACTRCQSVIVRVKQGARATFYCPTCQS